jgi:signal transduction histidine kinase
LNQATVAQEHYCTAATQLVMAQLYPYLFSQPKNGRRLVATSVADELHEVGLRIVTDLFEANGWDTVYFGANVPFQGLLQALEQHRPDLLLISATIAYHLPAVEELIARVRSAAVDPAVTILVGGYPFNLDPELWRRVGADASAADAMGALQTANRLFDLPTPTETKLGKTVPADESTPVETAGVLQPERQVVHYDELSRLNNDLITVQRELVKKNADLERVITERKRLEKQVQNAQKMEAVGRLAGGVAHALNNLMTTVLGYSEIMLGKMESGHPFFAFVQEIKRSSSRTAALTQKLLAFGRKQLLTLRRVDLNSVLAGLEPVVRALLGRVHLEMNLATNLASTRADQDHLEEAILVLVRNALDAMPQGGRMTLQTANVELDEAYVQVHPEVHPGSYVMLSISDTGTGMDEESLVRLFEPFYSSKNFGSDSGLGLAAVYGFVKQCGGDIEVQSVLHEGTTFRLYLPGDEAVSSSAQE